MEKICQNRHCTITSFLAYLEAQTGFCINSSSFSFSRPLRTLFWGVLPGNKSLVIVSSGLSGNHTSNAQMDTKLANGSHNSFPSTLIPDLKVPANKYVYSYKCMKERERERKYILVIGKIVNYLISTKLFCYSFNSNSYI